jgi:hypothetical protein
MITFNVDAWGWPQYTIIAMYIFNLLWGAASHGKPKTGVNNIVSTLIGTVLGFWILYSGGFFK